MTAGFNWGARACAAQAKSAPQFQSRAAAVGEVRAPPVVAEFRAAPATAFLHLCPFRAERESACQDRIQFRCMPLTVFDIRGIPGNHRELIEAAVVAGCKHTSAPLAIRPPGPERSTHEEPVNSDGPINAGRL
jgi:hypothetical protein